MKRRGPDLYRRVRRLDRKERADRRAYQAKGIATRKWRDLRGPYWRARRLEVLRTVLALLALLLAGPTFAQTECSPDACTFRFGVPSPDGWPGWEVEALPAAYAYGDTRVMAGQGLMRVLTLPPTTFTGNHAHLRWLGTEGMPNASADLQFYQRKASLGWIDKHTDGYGWWDCHYDQPAPRLSDELFCVTVADAGDSWVGACLGGDLLPLAQAVLLDFEHAPTGFSILAALQKFPGEDVPRVLGYVQLPAIPMGARWTPSVTVAQDGHGTWYARVKASRDGETLGTSFPLQHAPDLSGTVGFVGATPPAMSCIYLPGGEIKRAVAVSEVKAWK
jgi:hypothetical protein